ncbi:hypothetical protein [Sphaerimonospora mesophila]|uniref:hypothetical protein n=1 Tax=Sphaerimonospora mesophila TaxID=37483 RepID=UPI0006E1EDD9
MAKQNLPPAHSQSTAPAPLTQAAAAVLATELRRVENERANQSTYRADLLRKRDELARQRDDLGREVDATDTVLAELDGTADRYRRRLAEAGYPLQDTAVWPLPGQQGASQHAVWNGGDAPHTGLIAAVPAAPTDNPPVGHCIYCGNPVWWDTNERGERQLNHAIGSLCNPADPNSRVATIGEETPERPS